MRNISFMLTTAQVIARQKYVTRRLGWENAKVGEQLQGCEKCQGRRHGEPLIRLAIVEIKSVRREKLRRMTDEPVYGKKECVLEGFPAMSPAEFVTMFCEAHAKCTPETEITRIEFRYV